MTRRTPKRLAATLVGASVLCALLTVPVQALPILDPDPTPTPTPTRQPDPDPEPEPTEQPPPPPGGGGSSQKPPKPPRDPAGSTGGGSSGGGGTRPGGSRARPGGSTTRPPGTRPGVTSGSGATPWGTATVVGPPSGGEGGFGLEGWATREKSPPRTTTELLKILAKTYGRAPTRSELSRGFGRFPILGYTWFQDDYGAPRFLGRVSRNAGNDLFAERGTPVAATIDGTIWKYAVGGRGGNAIWLMGKDGVRYYYGHMDRFAFKPRLGRRLKQGEVFGFVGNTGSAAGMSPHVHFEVNPGGNGTVNPKPRLDRWLDDAIAAAQRRLEGRGSFRSVPESNAGWAGIMSLLDVPRSDATPLWMLALDASASTTLADDAIDELLATQSWDGFVADPFVGASGPEASDPFGLGLSLLASTDGPRPGLLTTGSS